MSKQDKLAKITEVLKQAEEHQFSMRLSYLAAAAVVDRLRVEREQIEGEPSE